MFWFSDYPERATHYLKREWTKTLVVLVLALADLLTLLFGSPNGELAQAVRLFGPILGLVALAFLLSTLRETFRVRLVPSPEGKYNGLIRYEKCKLALSYLRDRSKGRAIARAYRTLLAVAESNSITPLTSFGSHTVFDEYTGTEVVARDPREAIAAVNSLIRCLVQQDVRVREKDSVVTELQDVIAVLEEISSNDLQFYFAIMI